MGDTVRTIVPLVQVQHLAPCQRCKKKIGTGEGCCECWWPYPSKRDLRCWVCLPLADYNLCPVLIENGKSYHGYGRQQMEIDIDHHIERQRIQFQTMLLHGQIDGFQLLRAYRNLTRMELKCRFKLIMAAKRMQDVSQDVEATEARHATLYGPVDRYYRRICTKDQQSIEHGQNPEPRLPTRAEKA